MKTDIIHQLPVDMDRDADRMGIAIAIAVILHLLLLVVGFTPAIQDALGPDEKTLDIVLVTTKSDKAPDKADFLAQYNQQGGGTLDKAVKPTDILPSPVMDDPSANIPMPEESQPAESSGQEHIITSVNSNEVVDTDVPKPEQKPEQPSITDVFTMGMQMTRLSADLATAQQAMAKSPRRAYISASTKEYRFANYLHDWTKKVERVGNLNYPDEALRAKLTGRLRLEVILAADGRIRDLIVRESSGHQILDDSAKRIVRLASPYQPFPKNISKDTDELHITRTWIFSGDIVINQD